MKVKIGDKICDANEEPIMLIFENEMQKISVAQHLTNMPEEARRYCMFPDDMNQDVIKEFMKIDSDKPLGLMEQIRLEQANKPPVRLEEELSKPYKKPNNMTIYGGFEFIEKIRKALPKKYFK